MTFDEEKRQRWLEFMQSIAPDISPQAVRLVGDLRRVGYTMHQIGQASIAASGLSHAQYMVLMNLYMGERIDGRAQLNPSEISERLGSSRNSISSLIRGLEEDGLIVRHLDEQDRRKFNIGLTENGRALVSQYAHQHIGIVGGCFNKLSHDEQTGLGDLLAHLAHNLDDARVELEGKEAL